MRKRSGGLHCQTEQQFIELAQLSQQKCGLYYDDELNRKKSELNKSRTKNKNKQKQVKDPSKLSAFLNFDFNEDDIENKQTLIELTKSSNKRLSINITIICSNPQFERIELQSMLQENDQSQTLAEIISFEQKIDQGRKKPLSNEQKFGEQRLIDLYIHKIWREESKMHIVYKFWFMKINSINPQICETYLNISTQLFRINGENNSSNIDLEQHPFNSGKRHAIRDVKNSSQMLSYIPIKDVSSEEKKGDSYSCFSPKYLGDYDNFFGGQSSYDERLEEKR